ncbi:glucose 1-dehydrogenase [Stygiolobus caldivivus]|uniref:Glucose 1-dehydrogenase n=1 Tax=Stygiolobus caldivivus TaxID=2824673 RepID=A0A8D5ZK50_9CREN|nr:glucose 1-dehydrogenase [Stygiolobus caldivivus]BCU71010.1 alcohol dehydrogenase [Stygiolobus caldivivus]
MKAITIKPNNIGVEVKDVEIREQLRKGQALIKTVMTGICGTDRGIVSGKISFAYPPEGYTYLVLGHEGLGRVEETGEDVNELKKGDYVVPVVRRGCGECLNCKIGRQDFCETGKFVEAGIRGKHGFMREEFVDDEKYLVKVPEEVRDVAVLTEPLSNVVKAIDELLFLQRRMIWTCEDSTLECRNAYIVGTGPIGTFFAMVLRTLGLQVFMLNRREPSDIEAYISEKIGATFYDTRKGLEGLPEADLIVDTSGVPEAFIPLMKKLKHNSALVLFGTVEGEKAEFVSDLVTEIVEKNILIMGSVNASKKDFQGALNYLSIWKYRYGDVLTRMITRVVSIEEAPNVLTKKVKGEVKTVIKWS